MTEPKSFRHQDYEFQCSAKALDNGKFAPVLIVSKQVWPSRPRTIAVPGDACLTEDIAIHAAYDQGVEWVLNHG
jgi:hypothetical protein